MIMRVIALLLAVTVASASVSPCDLKRATQWTPRREYRAVGSLAASNHKLNKHLRRHPQLVSKPCEEFSAAEVRSVLRVLFSSSAPELRAVYSAKDGRRARYASLEEMEAEWQQLDAGDVRVRDAHCHEAVMWYVHHITSEQQIRLREGTLVLPLLPVKDHTVIGRRTPEDAAGRFYDSRVTCQDCHIGGMDAPPPMPDPADLPRTAAERSRVCDTQFKDFGIECGPCDGIDGIATGDAMRFYNQTECHVVAEPDQVPEAERVPVVFPEKFTVEVVGSADHMGGRSQSSPHVYTLSHGVLYGDIAQDSDLWLFRHDTKFTSMWESGVRVPLSPEAHTTYVHAQSRKQRSEGMSGAQVSVVENMPSLINPAFLPRNCSCAIDVVGIPTLQRIENLQYKGRIRLPELEFVGGEVVLDHWANWFFHIFMDTNRSNPVFGKAPSRISDSLPHAFVKTGFSVYGRWQLGDPALQDPEIWSRGLPPLNGTACANPKSQMVCANISQATFPPRGELAPTCPFRVV